MANEPQKESLSGKRVALGITGGIAAYKAAEILRELQRAGCTVRILAGSVSPPSPPVTM